MELRRRAEGATGEQFVDALIAEADWQLRLFRAPGEWDRKEGRRVDVADATGTTQTRLPADDEQRGSPTMPEFSLASEQILTTTADLRKYQSIRELRREVVVQRKWQRGPIS